MARAEKKILWPEEIDLENGHQEKKFTYWIHCKSISSEEKTRNIDFFPFFLLKDE